jgi:hypothetical protein
MVKTTVSALLTSSIAAGISVVSLDDANGIPVANLTAGSYLAIASNAVFPT